MEVEKKCMYLLLLLSFQLSAPKIRRLACQFLLPWSTEIDFFTKLVPKLKILTCLFIQMILEYLTFMYKF